MSNKVGRPLGVRNGNRQQGVCLTCNRTFDKRNSKSKYCSRKCFEISESKVYEIGICKRCGKKFVKKLPNGRHYRAKQYCSRSCATSSVIRKKGYHLTEEHRKKIGDAQRGCKGNNWQGGVMLRSSMTQAERKTRRYKLFRQSMFERDNFRCVECGSNNKIELHHIKPYATNKELAYNTTNVKTLCRECHKKTDSFAKNAAYHK